MNPALKGYSSWKVKSDIPMGGRTSAIVLPIALATATAVIAQTHFVVPNFDDLTIKTRRAHGVGSSTELLYLKGARERREFLYDSPGHSGQRNVMLMQCDQRRSVQLNPEAKLYAVSVLEDWSEQVARGRPVPEGQGPEVTTTFDAVDTGERRGFGRYVARRVRTTVTVEPSAGANTPASVRESDGWYIDLPGLGCDDTETTSYLAAGTIGPGGVQDRHRFKTKSMARRGYAIEETNRFTQTGRTSVDRVELVELSENPLDPSLFDIPVDYRPALPLVRGGYDMTRRRLAEKPTSVVLG